MALEMNNINGVICLKGTISNSHVQEVKGYFKALLLCQNTVNINLCQVHKGIKKLTVVLDDLKSELDDTKTLNYYGFASPAVTLRYAQLNHSSNFYQAA
jgi:hypothetical protein